MIYKKGLKFAIELSHKTCSYCFKKKIKNPRLLSFKSPPKGNTSDSRQVQMARPEF